MHGWMEGGRDWRISKKFHNLDPTWKNFGIFKNRRHIFVEWHSLLAKPEGNDPFPIIHDICLLLTYLLIHFCKQFVCFVALRPKSTAMVMAGRSVHLTTLFSWASLNKQITNTFACN